jgi:hypothetical protein
MIRFLLTIAVLYIVVKVVKQILFPARAASGRTHPNFKKRRQGIEELEEAEFTEVDTK